MNKHLGKDFGELEITDLIEESVSNATQRRQQIDNSLVDITEDEAKKIEGGLNYYSSSTIFIDPNPTTNGMKIKEPIWSVTTFS